MKSYIQGIITGGVFVFAIMVLMGSTNSDKRHKIEGHIQSEVGRYTYHYYPENRKHLIFDSSTGIGYGAVRDFHIQGIESFQLLSDEYYRAFEDK